MVTTEQKKKRKKKNNKFQRQQQQEQQQIKISKDSKERKRFFLHSILVFTSMYSPCCPRSYTPAPMLAAVIAAILSGSAGWGWLNGAAPRLLYYVFDEETRPLGRIAEGFPYVCRQRNT